MSYVEVNGATIYYQSYGDDTSTALRAVRISRIIMIPPVNAARLRTRRCIASCHRLRRRELLSVQS